jgi:hypothetical protein
MEPSGTQHEIPLSTDIAGVNMRIDSGAFRKLRWHTADEWAYMLTGSARVRRHAGSARTNCISREKEDA